MFGFGKKEEEQKAPEGGNAEAATMTKETHDAEHVDEKGEKTPKAEKVGEVCEFC